MRRLLLVSVALLLGLAGRAAAASGWTEVAHRVSSFTTDVRG